MDGRRNDTAGLERCVDHEDDHTRGLEIVRLDQDEFPQTHTYPVAPTTSVSNTSTRYTNKEDSGKRSVQSARICGMRRSAFWFSAILAVIITIVAATLAGSLTAQKQHAASSIRNPTASPTTASSSNSTAAISNPPLASPASDCSSLSLKTNGTYVVKTNALEITQSVAFNIKCGSDWKLPLVMAMRTFSFEDCISACASHATLAQNTAACVAAVYKPDSGESLTCWLKSTGSGGGVSNAGVDSAKIEGS